MLIFLRPAILKSDICCGSLERGMRDGKYGVRHYYQAGCTQSDRIGRWRRKIRIFSFLKVFWIEIAFFSIRII